MSYSRYRPLLLPALLVTSFGGLLLAQNAPEDQAPAPAAAPTAEQKLLVVNGKDMPGAAAEFGGHYYISADSVAQITKGSLTIEPNRVVLVTPGEAAEPAPAAAAQAAEAQPPIQGMTREFARQALSALAYMREWKAAVATVVTFGVPVVGTWPDDYRDRVMESVAQAQVAAMSQDDQNALGLLENEADNLTNWAGQVVAARQAMNAEQNINPNTLGNDLTYQKISKCAEFLNEMLGSGVFEDDSSCH